MSRNPSSDDGQQANPQFTSNRGQHQGLLQEYDRGTNLGVYAHQNLPHVTQAEQQLWDQVRSQALGQSDQLPLAGRAQSVRPSSSAPNLRQLAYWNTYNEILNQGYRVIPAPPPGQPEPPAPLLALSGSPPLPPFSPIVSLQSSLLVQPVTSADQIPAVQAPSVQAPPVRALPAPASPAQALPAPAAQKRAAGPKKDKPGLLKQASIRAQLEVHQRQQQAATQAAQSGRLQAPAYFQASPNYRSPANYRAPVNTQAPVDYQVPQNIQVPQNVQVPHNVQVPQSIHVPRDYQVPQVFQVPQVYQIPQVYRFPQDYPAPQVYQFPQDYPAPPVYPVPHDYQFLTNIQVPANYPVPTNIQLPVNFQTSADLQAPVYYQVPTHHPTAADYQNLANFPVPARHEAPASYRIPASYPVPPNYPVPAIQQFPAIQHIPATQQIPLSQQIPVSQQSLPRQLIPASQQILPTQRTPLSQQSPASRQAPTSQQLPESQQVETISPIPANQTTDSPYYIPSNQNRRWYRSKTTVNFRSQQDPTPAPSLQPPPAIADPDSTITSSESLEADLLQPPPIIADPDSTITGSQNPEIDPSADLKMGIPIFNNFARDNRVEHELPLQELHPADLKGTPRIGIEAIHFIEQFRHPSKEPLIPALGGFPLALESLITKHIKQLEKVGTKVWVYFDGLDCAFDKIPHQKYTNAAHTVSDAYDIYERGDPTNAIEKFRQADFPDLASLTAFMKCVLHKNGIRYVTAPFRALAQMKKDLDKDIIHLVYASTEALLYDIPRIITKINLVFEPREFQDANGNFKREMEFLITKSTYYWIDSKEAIKLLGNVSPEVFHDALLLSGSSYLEIFPPLLNSAQFPQPPNFRQIVDVVVNYLGETRKMIEVFQGDERDSENSYLERFQKVFTAINTMPVLHNASTVATRNLQDQGRLGRTPKDLHLTVGLCLPPELLWYMYMGLIGPRLMNWLTKGELKVLCPMAGEATSQYRKLVKDDLKPIRYQGLALLAYSVNRWFSNRSVNTTYWFEGAQDSVLCKELTPEKDAVSTWRVRNNVLFRRAEQLRATESFKGPGTLYFAFRALADSDFVASTISTKSSSTTPLDNVKEIVANVIWRFMYLRGYVDSQHQMTNWGKVMQTALDKLSPDGTREQAEAVFVAVEMLRLGLLNVDELVPGGAPSRGSDTDKTNCILVSRVGCIGKMRQRPKGYSGPLSRSLLAFHSLVSELRRTLRDLLEVITAVLFLDGQATRLREDYEVIADWLPLQENWSAGLGVLTMTYLDEIATSDNPHSEEEQVRCMNQSEEYLIHTEVKDSFIEALKVWKAVVEGAVSAGKLVDDKTKNLFTEVNDWLLPRSKAFA